MQCNKRYIKAWHVLVLLVRGNETKCYCNTGKIFFEPLGAEE